jgi:hypothetical protein
MVQKSAKRPSASERVGQGHPSGEPQAAPACGPGAIGAVAIGNRRLSRVLNLIQEADVMFRQPMRASTVPQHGNVPE